MDEFISKTELQSVSVSKWYDPDGEEVTLAIVFQFKLKIPFDLVPEGYVINGDLIQEADDSYIFEYAWGIPIIGPGGSDEEEPLG